MENKYFIKFMEHSSEFYELIRQRPSAFVLLALIVDRSRKVSLDINDGIEVGEAFIGDVEKYKATPQSYRTDKRYLEKFKLVTFKSTNKGTVAKIVKSSIFDISRTTPTSNLTNQQQSSNIQLTTKQEERSNKEEESQAKPMEKKDFFHDIPLNPSMISLTKVSQEYWDLHAQKIAEAIGIEHDSWKFINGERDWLKKAKVATPKSIKAFLESANDWEE